MAPASIDFYTVFTDGCIFCAMPVIGFSIGLVLLVLIFAVVGQRRDSEDFESLRLIDLRIFGDTPFVIEVTTGKKVQLTRSPQNITLEILLCPDSAKTRRTKQTERTVRMTPLLEARAFLCKIAPVDTKNIWNMVVIASISVVETE